MLTLAFDTATRWGRFALAEDGRLLDYRPMNVSGSYADALLPVVESMLADAGRSLEEVARIAVTRGPGSFTGLRIGVATAKGLAYALGAELHAVPTPAAMAADMLDGHPDRDLAMPALDARRGEIYAAIYRREGGWVEALAAPAAATPDAWWARLKALAADPEAPVFAGDGVGMLLGEGASLRPELRERGEPALRCWTAAHPRTARALALAVSAGEAGGTAVHPFTLTPLYARASEAEVKRGLDLTPGSSSGPVRDRRRGEDVRVEDVDEGKLPETDA